MTALVKRAAGTHGFKILSWRRERSECVSGIIHLTTMKALVFRLQKQLQPLRPDCSLCGVFYQSFLSDQMSRHYYLCKVSLAKGQWMFWTVKQKWGY